MIEIDDWELNHAAARARTLRTDLAALVVHAADDDDREAVRRVQSWADAINDLGRHGQH